MILISLKPRSLFDSSDVTTLPGMILCHGSGLGADIVFPYGGIEIAET